MATSIKENILNSLKWFWGKLQTTYVANLASTNDNLALSASQGKILNDSITNLDNVVLKGYKGTQAYYGIILPGGGEGDWLRTTGSGIIPYSADATNGKSMLGTSTWPFAAVYSKTFIEGGTALASKYLGLGGGTVTGTLILSKTTDAQANANNSPALIVGGPVTGLHLEMDGNEIMAKATATTGSALYLNSGSGLVYANDNMVGRYTATPTSGQLLIADGTTGGLKTSGYTTGSFAAASHTHAYAASNHTHTSVQDANSTGNAVTFCYSMAGLALGSITWLACWNGYQLRAINKNQFAAASHTHSYLPLSGGTVTGHITTKDYNNYSAYPINSNADAGKRVSHCGCNAAGTVFSVECMWGSTSAFSVKNLTIASSDVRIKQNIKDSDVSALSLVNSIKIRQFDWDKDYYHGDNAHCAIGFIADELEELDPALAVGGGYEEDGTMNIKAVDNFYLMGYAIKAIQELNAKIETLEKRIDELTK